jgi:hypothetical protein
LVDGEDTSSPQSSSSLLRLDAVRDFDTDILVWAMECGREVIPFVAVTLLIGSMVSGEEIRLEVGRGAGDIFVAGDRLLKLEPESSLP